MKALVYGERTTLQNAGDAQNTFVVVPDALRVVEGQTVHDLIAALERAGVAEDQPLAMLVNGTFTLGLLRDVADKEIRSEARL